MCQYRSDRVSEEAAEADKAVAVECTPLTMGVFLYKLMVNTVQILRHRLAGHVFVSD